MYSFLDSFSVAAQPDADNNASEPENDEIKDAPVEKPEIISWRRKPDDEDGGASSEPRSERRYSPDRRRRQNGL